MHVALIIDQERLEQEQSMLNRLCIGLMTEGVQVTRVVPDSAMPESVSKAEIRIALARRIETPMRVLPWMRRSRVGRIAELMGKSMPDILYAVGQTAWQLGVDLGKAIDRPVVIDVCSAHQARLAPKPQNSDTIGGYVACTGWLARLLGQRVDAELVSMVPMGVAMPRQARMAFGQPEEAPAIAVIGGARDTKAYDSLLSGLSGVVREGEVVQIFLELRGPHEHEIWRKSERMDLLKFISAIGEASMYRSLITRCDLLLMPERYGELRSIMLEAMAVGIPVIAADDPALDMLINGETALLVEAGRAEAWTEHVLRAMREPDQARKIGHRARNLVASHHRSSDQLTRFIQTMERAQGGVAFRIAPDDR